MDVPCFGEGGGKLEAGSWKPSADGRGEEWRKVVHLGVGAGALVVRFLEPWMIFTGAALGVLFNLVVLPRLAFGRRLYRKGEGLLAGIGMYPVGVLLAFLLFPIPAAAAAWGVLAAADCASNEVGRRFPLKRLPWNPGKSWGGTLAFLVVAGPVAWGLAAWTLSGHPLAGATPGRLALGAALAALAGALAESLPLPITDNLVVILAAGGALAAVLLLPWT